MDESIVTMFSSLNITIKHRNSESDVADTRSAKDQNALEMKISMLGFSGKTKETLYTSVVRY